MPPENLEQSPVTPQPETPSEAPRTFVSQGPLKQIRTYQGDIANAISSKQESLVSIRAAEKARTAESSLPTENEDHPIRSLLFVLGTILLLAAAGAAGWLGYEKYIVKTAVPVVEIPKNRFLLTTSTLHVDTTNLTRNNLISIVSTEREKELASGNIEQITLEKGSGSTATPLTPTQLMILLESKSPSSLVRSLNPLFMFGIIGQSADVGSNEPFLLMKVDSYDVAFAGMLSWEQDMTTDLAPLFMTSDQVLASNPTFKDVALKNKDTRELFDESGKSALIYTFYSQNLLIITRSESALRALMTELDTQALSR